VPEELVPPNTASGDPRAEEDPEARWPAVAAVLASGGLYAALPGYLAIGPRWLLLVLVCIFAAIITLTHHTGHIKLNIVLGHTVSALLTAFMVWSVILLVRALFAHKESPGDLLRSAASLWATNVLVFAVWYWRLDAGGPHARDQRAGHETGAFLFPQMTLEGPAGCDTDGGPWSPLFIDYLFLAFNTSSAFSPTDVPVLSRWAKVLCMMQACISLTVVAILFGRAVNVL
jgi:hypothetical protein